MTPLRIGIIGSGSRGIHCFGKLFGERDDTRVIALADLNLERMKAAAEELGRSDLQLYTDPQAMLTREPLDAVVITTPDYLHCEYILMALAAGRHVLTDKPLATRAADGVRIARAARAAGRIVDMGFNLRHETVCRRIKELIDEGAIGQVQLIDNRDYYDGGRTYFSRWNRFYGKGGGLFCHKGSHDFDLLNWYNAGALPVKVSAFAGMNVLLPQGLPFKLAPGEQAGPYCEVCQVADRCEDRYGLGGSKMWTGAARAADGYNKDECMYLSAKDTHDSGIAIVEYDNGVRASHWECFFTPVSTRRFTIIGDRGHLDADLSLDTITVQPRWSNDRVEYKLKRPTGGHGGADPQMIAAFVHNLRSGQRPCATVRDGTLSVVIAEAAERSRRENRTVMIDELLTRQDLAELA
jgi:predicted dehydrogenase